MRKLFANKNLLFLIMALVVIFFFILYRTYVNPETGYSRKKVSLIVYGDDQQRWENLRQGAELVCNDKNADLTLITMMSENNVAEQEEIITREVYGGSDAIIIDACDSEQIAEYIKESRIRIPVIFLSSNSYAKDDYPCVAIDDYSIGYELGEEFVRSESDIVTVAVISDNTERESVSLRQKGFMDAIEGKPGKTLIWMREEREKNMAARLFIQRALVSEATDAIVTFDNSTTDALLDALDNLNQNSRLYCISTSDKAVYNLYNGKITALGFPYEYSGGYLAAMYATDFKTAGKMYSGESVDYKIVRKENMHDEDTQTLLFPFVN